MSWVHAHIPFIRHKLAGMKQPTYEYTTTKIPFIGCKLAGMKQPTYKHLI